MSYYGDSADSHDMIMFVSQWFGVGVVVSIPHHIRPMIAEYKRLWECHKGGKNLCGAPILLTNANRVNHFEKIAKHYDSNPKCHPPFNKEGGGTTKMLQVK